METKSWKEIKNNVYGEKGTERRDELEREIQGFKIGLLLKISHLLYLIVELVFYFQILTTLNMLPIVNGMS